MKLTWNGRAFSGWSVRHLSKKNLLAKYFLQILPLSGEERKQRLLSKGATSSKYTTVRLKVTNRSDLQTSKLLSDKISPWLFQEALSGKIKNSACSFVIFGPTFVSNLIKTSTFLYCITSTKQSENFIFKKVYFTFTFHANFFPFLLVPTFE